MDDYDKSYYSKELSGYRALSSVSLANHCVTLHLPYQGTIQAYEKEANCYPDTSIYVPREGYKPALYEPTAELKDMMTWKERPQPF